MCRRRPFKKTIKRYRKGVAFPSLLRVEGSKIDDYKAKLNDIYEKCCVSIEGHSSTTELATTPTIDELKIDFEEFKKVRKISHNFIIITKNICKSEYINFILI